jgi:NAD(P)-dependent dehydrogenase (short-subunit alcohol dehydrogenase family)
MPRLQGKRALITGAGGPMGRAIALRFAKENASLILNDISGTRLGETESLVRGRMAANDESGDLQPMAHLAVFRGDATDAAAVEELVQAAREALGGVDILINVVGGIRGEINQPFAEIEEKRWDDTFRLNLKGTFLLTRALAPDMQARGHGRIVNISSVDFAGAPNRADYGAAKAAVASLTRSLAAEFAPQVNVNCIAPGIINTTAVERLPGSFVEDFRARSLLGRLGEPEEIAAVALFFASEDAAYVTGETLAVSGGVPARL